MRTRTQSILFAAVAAVAAVGVGSLITPVAHAELNACGGIFLSSDASCGYRPKNECMTECMTVAVEESCVADVYNECASSCTTTASSDCENTCTKSCVNTCTTRSTTETPPSCMDLCVADCDSDGDLTTCSNVTYKGPCSRCAKYNCNKKCEARCGDEPDPVRVTTQTDCMPTCTDACTASCTAKVNTQCQVDCQEKTYTTCEQKMVEHCETECEDKGGAIFCDGQFVNAADAHECADEMKTKVHIDVDDINSALERAGNDIGRAAKDVGKKVDEHVDTKCSVTNAGTQNGSSKTTALVGLPLLAIALWRSRRRAAARR